MRQVYYILQLTFGKRRYTRYNLIEFQFSQLFFMFYI